MSMSRPALGFGPELFIRDFPRFESLELARLSPDFQHESPHNMFLDAVVAQGIPGLLLVAISCALGMYWTVASGDNLSLVLGSALLAGIVAQQFTCFTAVTNVYFYVFVAFMAARADGASAMPRLIPSFRVATCGAALALVCFAVRLMVWDASTQSALRSVQSNNLAAAASFERQARRWALPGWSAEIFYSRRLAAFASESTDILRKVEAWRMARAAAIRAVWTAEDTQNAYYNLAELTSADGAAATSSTSIAADSSSLVPSRCPATLITSSIRPRIR
jgi:hypothetical protein